jgi:hypothetical protein
MVDLEDIHGTTDGLKRAYYLLDESNVLDVNKQLLKRFFIFLRREGLRKAPLLNNLNKELAFIKGY